MPQESVEKFCTERKPCIQKNKTRFRDSISGEKKEAATLYYLEDKGRMRKVANSFGIKSSTVSEIIGRVLFCFVLFFKTTISQTENHTELAYLLKTNGNK